MAPNLQVTTINVIANHQPYLKLFIFIVKAAQFAKFAFYKLIEYIFILYFGFPDHDNITQYNGYNEYIIISNSYNNGTIVRSDRIKTITI